MKECPKCGSYDINFDDYDVVNATVGRCNRCKELTNFKLLDEANKAKNDVEHIKSNVSIENKNISDDSIEKNNKSIIQQINLQESIKLAKNSNVIDLILTERDRQDKKYGPQSHNPEIWQSIMAEEFGEMAQAINETIFNNGEEKRKLGGIENIKKELIHILAVGFAMYIDLEGKK